MMATLEPARTWIAQQIRSRVVGVDPQQKNAQIFDTPGPRWFPENSPIRLVHSDASMFVGGLRALLLQSLHPLAMAGVAVVKRVHGRVVGVADDGRPYAANDPHLLHWVHLAETDSFLVAYKRYGQRTLSHAQADSYVEDAAVIARKLGVTEPPLTVRMLHDQLRAFRPEMRGTDAAREAARFLLIDPPLPLAARPAYLALSASAVALLPAWTRWPLRLPFLPVSEKLVIGPAGQAITEVIRWSMRRPAGADQQG